MTEGSRAFANLSLTVGGLVFQILVPRLAWLPIVALLALAAARTWRTPEGFQPGTIGVLVLAFLATGLVGATIAFDPSSAWPRFWSLCGAVALYFVVVRQPNSNTVVITGLASLTAAVLSVLLMAGAGRSTQGLDFPSLSTLLQRIPLQSSGAPVLPPNQAGGIVALLFPLSALDFLLSRRRKRGRGVLFSGLLLAISALGLLVSSSRGAWVALAVGLAVGSATWLMREVAKVRSRLLLAAPILVAVGLGIGLWWVLFLTPGLPSRVDTLLPGLPDAGSRFDLARQAIWIAQDFPWTGVGLGAFGGIYSRYMLLIPQFYFGYAHNMFLDVLVAQGPLALIICVALLFSTAERVNRAMGADIASFGGLIEPSVLAGLTVLILHGMIDSPAYAGNGIAVLFLYPALAGAWAETPTARPDPWAKIRGVKGKIALTGAVGLVLITVLLAPLKFKDALLGSWLSNVDAIRLAKVELAGWPNQDILLNKGYEADTDLAAGFGHALSLDSQNRGAYFRLGLMAMRLNDFHTATEVLSQAYSLSPDHRGIRKALGYSYVWDGNPDAAVMTLIGIPEARHELELYREWWLDQGNALLSQRTQEALDRMMAR